MASHDRFKLNKVYNKNKYLKEQTTDGNDSSFQGLVEDSGYQNFVACSVTVNSVEVDHHPGYDGIPDVVGRAVQNIIIRAVRFPEVVIF